jgi:hypothetical protein
VLWLLLNVGFHEPPECSKSLGAIGVALGIEKSELPLLLAYETGLNIKGNALGSAERYISLSLEAVTECVACTGLEYVVSTGPDEWSEEGGLPVTKTLWRLG